MNLEVRKTFASHPPPFVAQAIRQFKVRCLATGNVNSNFSYNQLSAILGIIATSTTTSAFIAAVFRLKKVVVWGPVTTAGTSVTASLAWQNTSQDFESPPLKFSDTSISFDWPAFLNCSPPKGSLSDKWHGSGQTDELFALIAPTGSTVEFHFDWVLNDGQGVVAGPTIAGATTGVVYHNIVNNLTPISVNAI